MQGLFDMYQLTGNKQAWGMVLRIHMHSQKYTFFPLFSPSFFLMWVSEMANYFALRIQNVVAKYGDARWQQILNNEYVETWVCVISFLIFLQVWRNARHHVPRLRFNRYERFLIRLNYIFFIPLYLYFRFCVFFVLYSAGNLFGLSSLLPYLLFLWCSRLKWSFILKSQSWIII